MTETRVAELHHRDDMKLQESVNSLRKSRDEELKVLRAKTCATPKNKLFSEDGRLITTRRTIGNERDEKRQIDDTSSPSPERKRNSMSSVKQIQASLNQKSLNNSGVCLDLDSFYRQQKNMKKGDSKKKDEAKQSLRSFTSSYVAPAAPGAVKSKRRKRTIPGKLAKERTTEYRAADRAAAMIFTMRSPGPSPAALLPASPPQSPTSTIGAKDSPTVTQKRSPPWMKSKAAPSGEPQRPNLVHSMEEFYKIQRVRRKICDSQKKESVSIMRQGFSGVPISVTDAFAARPTRPSRGERVEAKEPDTKESSEPEPQTPSMLGSSESCDARVQNENSGNEPTSTLVCGSPKESNESIPAFVFGSPKECDGVIPAESQMFGSPKVEDDLEKVPEVGSPIVTVKFQNEDYRSFVFAIHATYGMILLYCTRKKSKGPHYQLPGGHVDEDEFVEASKTSKDPHTQLLIASQKGCARELYEETGIDIRDQLHRMEPAALRSDIVTDKAGKSILTCELKSRLYFFLQVTDDDFMTNDNDYKESGWSRPMTEVGSELMLRLSDEHQGFCFEADHEKAADMIRKHSGGKGSDALLMAMDKDRYSSGKGTMKPEDPVELQVARSMTEEEAHDVDNSLPVIDDSISINKDEESALEPEEATLVDVKADDAPSDLGGNGHSSLDEKREKGDLGTGDESEISLTVSPMISTNEGDGDGEIPKGQEDVGGSGGSERRSSPVELANLAAIEALSMSDVDVDDVQNSFEFMPLVHSKLKDDGSFCGDWVVEGSSVATQDVGEPVDLLPPPARKNLFKCCFGGLTPWGIDPDS